MLCAAVGITAIPAVAAPQGDAAAKALFRLTFTNVSSGRVLDVQNGSRDENAYIQVNPAPGSAPTWRINTGTANTSFAIVNDTTAKCLDDAYQLPRQRPCDGRATEKWYFQPVNGSAQKAFMIRHDGDNTCLSQQTDWSGGLVAAITSCDGTKVQQWIVPDSAYQVAWNEAVDYAAARCAKDTTNCSWDMTEQTPAFLLPASCVSPVWYNGTSVAVQWTFQLNTTTGWTNKIGLSLQASLTAGTGDMSPIKVQVTASITGSYEYTMDLRQELGNSLVVTVSPRQYGWVALSELATKVTGSWTFDTQGFPWTADDTVTVPVKSDRQGGASIYSARTSPTFTSCDATS